jgi:tRNA pseudouridine38-40 synthase
MIGERDFSAFRAAGCTARHAIREIHAVTITEVAPDLIHVEVCGNAFLRNMVRILVGTLVDVGEGRRTPSHILEIIESKDRTQAGRTAPAHGLYLLEVYY